MVTHETFKRVFEASKLLGVWTDDNWSIEDIRARDELNKIAQQLKDWLNEFCE